jgi:hypothetical protein
MQNLLACRRDLSPKKQAAVDTVNLTLTLETPSAVENMVEVILGLTIENLDGRLDE